jgi:hypothetical protein
MSADQLSLSRPVIGTGTNNHQVTDNLGRPNQKITSTSTKDGAVFPTNLRNVRNSVYTSKLQGEDKDACNSDASSEASSCTQYCETR